ncbi:hypothetical protein [Flammeovirga aprica]|uniref:Chromosome segregation protein SMC n=1 Tax=Flammeovirga aprica JL-4 TaxID=694437 RepID=A0A7X9S189_9BACT|nr:hypothetical protein [Flammeovirga aprica]NME72503.1 hypothetical protein [Flammeovirga aprica JL-4]
MLNLLQLYLRSDNTSHLQDRVQSKNVELVLTYTKLDSISTELNKQIQILDLMNEDIDSLTRIKNSLEKEKKELRSIQLIEENRYNQIKSKVSVYEGILKRRDLQITSLKDVNDSLSSENQYLVQQKTTLTTQIDSLQEHQGELEQLIDDAKALRAYNITIWGGNRSNKLKEGVSFKRKSTSQVAIRFKLSPNNLIKEQDKDIFLCLIDEEGATIYNPDNQIKFFRLKGSDENRFYTSKKTLNYQNDLQNVELVYESENLLNKGNYSVNLYCDGELLGKSSFSIL